MSAAAQPFVLRLSIEAFRLLLWEWSPRRQVATVQIRLPATAAGSPAEAHAVITPEGTIRLGVHWDLPAPSSLTVSDPEDASAFVFALEGPGAEAFDSAGPQASTLLFAASSVQDRFTLPVDAFKLVGYWRLGLRPIVENALRAQRGQNPFSRNAEISEEGAVVVSRAWLEQGPSIMTYDDPSSNKQGVRGASIDPAMAAMLRPHVIKLWGNKLSQEGPLQTSESDVERIFTEHLPKRLAKVPAGQKLPIVIYAHGGLVDLAAGIQIAANQIPWWNANGCYPIQFIWETGLFETIEKMIAVPRAERGINDITDAIVEAAARMIGGPQIWGNMKHSASTPFDAGAAGTKFVERLIAFVNQNPNKVSLHAVGHSAGSIFHAYLLQRLHMLGGPAFETLTLLAPAVTVDDYKRLVDPLMPTNVKQVRIFTMRREHELKDTVTAAYHKSLLYLIYHALEPKQEEPILGLEECLRTDAALQKRFGLSGKPSSTGSVVWSVTPSGTGSQASQSTTHGGFDNDVPTMNSVARGILGLADAADLPASFPPDTEERKAAMSLEPAALPKTPPLSLVLPPPESPPAPVSGNATGGSSRMALCVGINAYPAPNTLHGCVADSEAWAAALSSRGFAVDKLQDLGATRSNILGRLRALIQGSRAGDVIVFQYAGHGTQVPDLDGDETASGLDQAICPVDFADGNLLIDDDIRAVFDRLPAGVHLTCFMDNCNSATNTRFLVGKAPAPDPDSRVRYMELPAAIVERYVATRQAINGARALTGARQSAGTRAQMRWVAFGACRDDESAYETRGHGDFSSIAVPLLDKAGSLTNADFQKLILKGFGQQPRQHPNLDCRDDVSGELFLTGATDPRDISADKPAAADVADALQESKGASEKFSNGSRTADLADLFQSLSRLLR